MPSNIKSQVSGTVWKVEKATGEQVAEGDLIVIVESMKMEIPHQADGAGTLNVFIAEGDVVTEGQVLATVS